MSNDFEKFVKQTEVDRPEYKAHDVFRCLSKFIDFYSHFSMSIMCFPTMGTKAVINMDSYLYSSIQGTLESIKMILKIGHIGDAFSLLRKYHDAIVLNLYTNLYLEENRNQEKFIIPEITGWLNGSKKLPHDAYRTMLKYIQTNGKLNDFFEAVNTDESYKKTRERCNDHMHYNYFSNVMINDNKLCNPKRIELLDLFKIDLENLFILHLCAIFYLKDHYMMSSDYIDSLDVEMIPEPESQYWVAPFIQEVFSNLINLKRPDLVSMIKEKTSMQLF